MCSCSEILRLINTRHDFVKSILEIVAAALMLYLGGWVGAVAGADGSCLTV